MTTYGYDSDTGRVTSITRTVDSQSIVQYFDYTPRGQAVIARTPFGRFGAPEELTGATLFLASEKASGFVTGVSIPVDGGYLVHNI